MTFRFLKQAEVFFNISVDFVAKNYPVTWAFCKGCHEVINVVIFV
jgi:hypothetical protein